METEGKNGEKWEEKEKNGKNGNKWKNGGKKVGKMEKRMGKNGPPADPHPWETPTHGRPQLNPWETPTHRRPQPLGDPNS